MSTWFKDHAVSLVGTASLVVFSCVGSYEALKLGPTLQKTLANVAATTATSNDLLKDMKASLDDADVQGTMDTIAVSAKDSDDLIHDLRASLVGGKDTTGKSRDGVVPQVGVLLKSVTGMVVGLQKDTDTLTEQVGHTIRPLQASLQNVADLTLTLDDQIKEQSMWVGTTFKSLTKAVDDFDKLVNDPDISRLIAGSADTSGHLAESAKSLDIAMAPFRKKATMLKMILEKAVGMIKITFPL